MKKLLLILFVLLPALAFANLVPVVHKNGKWGYKEYFSTKFVIKPKFEKVQIFVGDYAFVRQKSLWGIIGQDGKFVVAPKYSSASAPYRGITIVELNGKFGFVKGTTEITAISFDKIEYLNAYSCFLVNSSGKYGLLDEQGKPLAKVEYDEIKVGANNTFDVVINGKKGLLNQQGKVVAPAEYESVAHNAHNTILVKLGGKYGLLDIHGQPLTKCEYDYIKVGYNDTFNVAINGKNGLLNQFGQTVAEVIYDSIMKYPYETFLVKLNGKYGLLDKQGRLLIPAQYDKIADGSSNETVFVELNDKCGLLNIKGETIIPLEYDKITLNKNGSFTVKIGNKYGLLDKNYNISIEVKYDNIAYLQNDTFVLANDGEWLLADAKGNKVDMPNNVILYTTSDGAKMRSGTHQYYDILKYSSLMSHTYENGCGVLVFKNRVTSIGESAFANCENLTSITIPNSVIIIGDCAFDGCNNLKSINIPDAVVSIEPGAFCGCCSLTSVSIPDSVKEIKDLAFYQCSGLVSMTIGKGVATVGRCAFVGCTGELTINSNAYNCYQYTERWGFSSTWSLGAFKESNFTKVVIGENVELIGKYAFCNCKSLQKVVFLGIPSYIAKDAFEGCSKLCVEYPNLSVLCKAGRKELGGAVVSKVCVNGKDIATFTKLVIPSDVTKIANGAFSGCSNLKSITIPNSVTSIGKYAFYDCSRLTSVTISNSVTEIGSYAFFGCSSLTSVTIPNSVIYIGECAFSDCRNLSSVTIGKGIEDIGDAAFYGCTSLKAVYLNATIPPYLGEEAFDYDAGRICCPIYVPSSSLRRYLGVGDNWVRYYRYIRGR